MESKTIKYPRCKWVTNVKFNEIVPGEKKTCAAYGAETIFCGTDIRNVQKSRVESEKHFKNIFK